MQSEKGFSLIETLIALALVGLIAIAFLNGLVAASRASFTTDELETAKNLAESQMEDVKKQGYAGSYAAAPITGQYIGYSASIHAELLRDGNIQKITLVIKRGTKVITTLEGYRVNR